MLKTPRRRCDTNLHGSVFILILLSLLLASCAPTLSKVEFQKRVAARCYNLRNHGVTSIDPLVTPNWRLSLKQVVASDPVKAAKILARLDSIHIRVILTSDSPITFTQVPDTLSVIDGVNYAGLMDGAKQALYTFLHPWKSFMLDAPNPGYDTDFQLENRNDSEYLLSMQKPSPAVFTVSKDFIVKNTLVSVSGLTVTSYPHFTDTPEGLLLTRMESTYVYSNGQTSEVHLVADYQRIYGREFLNRVHYSIPDLEMEFIFSDYQLFGTTIIQNSSTSE